jgi:hypothetical protein
MNLPIENHLVGRHYALSPCMDFHITAVRDKSKTVCWALRMSVGGGRDQVRLMDGTLVPEIYPSLEAAQEALQRVFDNYAAPLTAREIRRYFNEKWLRREEERDLLRRFKQALLKGDLESARKTFNGFSSWTREAIPDKVVYQLLRHAGKGKTAQ